MGSLAPNDENGTLIDALEAKVFQIMNSHSSMCQAHDLQKLLRTISSKTLTSHQYAQLSKILQRFFIHHPILDDSVQLAVLLESRRIFGKAGIPRDYRFDQFVSDAFQTDLSYTEEMELWIKLGFYRAQGNLKELVALLSASYSAYAGIGNQSKLYLFKARLFEGIATCLKDSNILSKYYTSFNPESLAELIIEHAFLEDELLLNKIREVTVALYMSHLLPDLFKRIHDNLHEDLKIKYHLMADLLMAGERNIDLLDDNLIESCQTHLSTNKSLGPAVADFLVCLLVAAFEKSKDTASKIFSKLLMHPKSSLGYNPLQIAHLLFPRISKFNLLELFVTCLEVIKVQLVENPNLFLPVYLNLCNVAVMEKSLKQSPLLIDQVLILQSLRSANENIQLQAMSLISKLNSSPLYPIAKESLDAVLDFVSMNMLLTTHSEYRQRAINALEGLLDGVRARLYALIRDRLKTRNVPGSVDHEVSILTNFWKRMIELMSDSIEFSNGPFSKLMSSLQLLQILSSKISNSASKSKSDAESTLINILEELFASKSCTIAKRLERICLDSSYECLQEMAAKLLLSLERSFMIDKYSEADLFERLLSPREHVQVGAARMMVLQSTTCSYLDIVVERLSKTFENFHLDELEAIAISDNPVGLFVAVRQLLVSRVYVDSEQPLAILNLCKIACISVTHVVSMASPEGAILGMASNDNDEENNLMDNQISDEKMSKRAMTMCWKIIKEATLTMATVLSQSSLLFNECMSCVDFFVELLFSIRHPGAYTALSSPLGQICSILLKSQEQHLQDYPQKVLQKAISQSLEHPEIQTTRRSAGLPFCILAILTSPGADDELRKSMIEKYVAPPILAIFRQSVDTEEGIAARVHALNILRALFRESILAGCMKGLISDGFAIAFSNFASSHWSIRNGSMMMFSALMTRTFGSKCGVGTAGCDETAKTLGFVGNASQIDFRTFYDLYPKVIDLLLEHFERVTESSNKYEKSISANFAIYPLLCILQRLKFSNGAVSSTRFDGYFLSKQRFQFLKWALSNRICKIRRISARILITMFRQSSILAERIPFDIFGFQNQCSFIIDASFMQKCSLNFLDGLSYFLSMLQCDELKELSIEVEASLLDWFYSASPKSFIERRFLLYFITTDLDIFKALQLFSATLSALNIQDISAMLFVKDLLRILLSTLIFENTQAITFYQCLIETICQSRIPELHQVFFYSQTIIGKNNDSERRFKQMTRVLGRYVCCNWQMMVRLVFMSYMILINVC